MGSNSEQGAGSRSPRLRDERRGRRYRPVCDMSLPTLFLSFSGSRHTGWGATDPPEVASVAPNGRARRRFRDPSGERPGTEPRIKTRIRFVRGCPDSDGLL